MHPDPSDALPGLRILSDGSVGWEPADPETFQGAARVKRLGGAGPAPEIKLFRVEFGPGARTHWHVHSGPQLLVVTEGRCVVQRWGEEAQVAIAGDVVHIAPGVKHWHGAEANGGATHIAVNVAVSTTWLEPAPEP
jgi:quercetin dioxygenase-like cupin family protein